MNASARNNAFADDLRSQKPGAVPVASGGAVPSKDGTAFSVWAPDAAEIVVHIYDKNEQETGVYALPERRGGFWMGFVKGVKPGSLYALESRGGERPGEGFYFKEGRLLADPCAKALSRPFVWNHDLYLNDSKAFMPKSIVPDPKGSFDWQGVAKPAIRREGVILYEANVKGMTMLSEEVPPEHRGKFLGMCHESVIEHLKSLGVTAVQLNPIAACMSESALAEKGLSNYWGYNPVCFMAPDPRFAVDPLHVVDEFRTMVRQLHRAGIAVILDVVYNHTAEGGFGGPVLSMKGLDARRYYAYCVDDHGAREYGKFLNASGCGNSFNCDEMPSLNLVLDTLNYYLSEMQVDGFRFDLAVTLCRESHGNENFGFVDNSAFVKACFCSDLIGGSILIAEPWDCGMGGYRLGHFPLGWSEQNDRFRDTVRRFWRGDGGLLGDFATRIMGSRDVFFKGYRSINASVNYVTYHDGFTLEDLVSYSQKHNEPNGWGNTDGASENFSTNCGAEGPTDDPVIKARRWQLKRNLVATVLISQGTPHLLGGDEFSRTQRGNNNAYCQDNEISWMKWDRSPGNLDFIKFIGRLTRLRRSSRMLSELNLADDSFHLRQSHYYVHWYTQRGVRMGSNEWNDPGRRLFMLCAGDMDRAEGEQWCILFNGTGENTYFMPPAAPIGRHWVVQADTSVPDGAPDESDRDVTMSVRCSANSIKIMTLMVQEQGREDDYGSLMRHLNRS